MGPSLRRFLRAVLAVTSLFLTPPLARAGVTQVQGTVRSHVQHLLGPFPIETDLNLVDVPLTLAKLPATASARLDSLDASGAVVAAAQSLATLVEPDLTGANPNDVGIDLGVFSNDDMTGWSAESFVEERRTLRFTGAELGAPIGLGNTTRLRSRVLLSGVMLVAAVENGKDLRGVESNFYFTVAQLRSNQPPITLLEGNVSLVGRADGTIAVERITGALGGLFLPIISFNDQIPDLPLAQAIIFTGLEFPYEYDAADDETFELRLSVTANVVTKPGGIGAAATFGVPQEGFTSVFEKVKHGDAANRLTQLISQRVDTTGAAYLGGSPSNGTAFPFLPGLCGMASVEIAGLLAAAVALRLLSPVGRSRRLRRGSGDSGVRR